MAEQTSIKKIAVVRGKCINSASPCPKHTEMGCTGVDEKGNPYTCESRKTWKEAV
jgi:hypothetical protein